MSAWIGVDLDGTLAHYDGWRGPEYIGEPIPAMLDRVRGWLAEGKRVKIFTARASVPSYVAPVAAWLKAHGLDDIKIADAKRLGPVLLAPDNGIFHLYNISSRNRRTKPPSASMRCSSSQAGRRLLLLQ